MRKSNFINISVHKKKGKVLRVIENYEKLNAAADIVIKDTKKMTPVNTVKKSLFLKIIFYLIILRLSQKAERTK